MPSLNTELHGYAVKFSPFHKNLLAVDAHDPLTIAPEEPLRRGRLLILNASPSSLTDIVYFNTFRGLNQCAWSKLDENILVCGDTGGLTMMFNLNLPPSDNPVLQLDEHSSSINCIDWNPIRGNYFLTSSSDCTVNLWSTDYPVGVMSTFNDHNSPIYSSVWNPHHLDIFASAGRDNLRLYDIRRLRSIAATGFHSFFVSCDWCTYNENRIATTAYSENCIRVWDIRHMLTPYIHLGIVPSTVVNTGDMIPFKVKFSLHRENHIASCSTNSEVALWDHRVEEGPPIERYVHHDGPVFGFDMSVHVEGLMASTGVDGLVHVWKDTLPPRPGLASRL